MGFPDRGPVVYGMRPSDMRKRFGSPRFLLIAASAIGAPVSAVCSATPISSLHRSGPARVTIRGSGNAISVDRTEPPEEFIDAEEEPSPAVLDEAIGMKESGTTDDALVGYLKAHRAELPALVDFDTLSALRRAGAGGSVVTYLASVAAVEVGPTGAEGTNREEPVYRAPEDYGPGEGEMSNALPAWLGWGGGVIAEPGRGGLHRHAFHGRGGFPRGMHGKPGMAGPRSFGRVPRR